MAFEITRGTIAKPQKTVIYGVEGIGKSTLAAQFPSPLFIDVEGGTAHIDVPRLPQPTSWSMLLDEVRWIRDFPYECGGTLVIDTLDWAQQLCAAHICGAENKKSIEDFGYGSGYTKVYEEFGKFLNLLTDVCERGLNVLCLAHASIERIEQPGEIGTYDHWGLKLQTGRKTSIANMVKEWADAVLFCNYKTNINVTDAKSGKAVAQGGRIRQIHTSHSAAYDAKNRWGMADSVPMEWNQIAPYIPVPNIPNPTQAIPPAQNVATQATTNAAVAAQNITQVEFDAIPVPFDTNEPNAAQNGLESLPDNLAKLKVQIEDVGLTTGDVMGALVSKGYATPDMPFEALTPREDIVAWIPTVLDSIKASITTK